MNIAIQRDEIVRRVDDGGNLLVRRVEDELIFGDPFQIPCVQGGEWQRQDRIVQALSSRGRANPRGERRLTRLRHAHDGQPLHAGGSRCVIDCLAELRPEVSSWLPLSCLSLERDPSPSLPPNNYRLPPLAPLAQSPPILLPP